MDQDESWIGKVIDGGELKLTFSSRLNTIGGGDDRFQVGFVELFWSDSLLNAIGETDTFYRGITSAQVANFFNLLRALAISEKYVRRRTENLRT